MKICVLFAVSFSFLLVGCKTNNIFHQTKNIEQEKYSVYLQFDSSLFQPSRHWGGNAPILDFSYKDSRTYRNVSIPVTNDNKETKIYIENPVILNTEEGKQTIISPGNSYTVKVEESTGNIIVVGNQTAAFKETLFINDLFFRNSTRGRDFNFLKSLYIDSSMSIEKIYDIHNKIRQITEKNIAEKKQMIDSLSFVFNPSDDFLTAVQNLPLFTPFFNEESNWLITYQPILVNKDIYENLLQSHIDKYINTLNDEQVFYYSNYLDIFFYSYFNYKKKNDSLYSNMLNEKKRIALIEKIKTNFKGVAKDYLLGNMMIELKKRNSNYIERNYTKLLAEIDNKYIRKNTQVAFRDLNEMKEFVYDFSEKKQSLKDIMAMHKGNLLLVDVWASWCGPCVAENKQLDSIKNIFKTSKIKFLHLSSDKNALSWRQAINSRNYNPAIHYRLPESSLFDKQHQIKTIPRFLLYNTDGKIINDDLPYPSTGDSLINIIKENL